MIVYFVNPFNVLDGGWIAILDVATFIIIPYILLKKVYEVVWWRVILFYIGFMLTQISMFNYPMLEYVLELAGILLILYACLGDKEKPED